MAARLIDAGPLIAYFDRTDRRHADAVRLFESLTGPVFTVWPVLAEVCHMLGRYSSQAARNVLESVQADDLRLIDLDSGDIPRISALMSKYSDRGMDLADAALVRAAEREGIDTIATFDLRDFRVYRALGIGALKIVPASPRR